jgi:hypothetical protein
MEFLRSSCIRSVRNVFAVGAHVYAEGHNSAYYRQVEFLPNLRGYLHATLEWVG